MAAVQELPRADLRPKRIRNFVKPLLVKPNSKVRLPQSFDPAFTAGLSSEDGVGAQEVLRQGVELLADYQDRLAAQNQHGLLIVLQAMDAAGKDGTIRHVMSGVNPQGVDVVSFKVPSTEELDHDYLWRYARRLPERGKIGIFNRSYYEEVLVVRVHPALLERQHLPEDGADADMWRRRFREINNWERYLTDNGFHIVKLFLNVSREEQRKRFLSRIDEEEKNWKLSAADAQERQYWDDYQAAFSEILSNTSTEWAPWYVIPADRKWFARIASAAVIADALIKIDPQYPAITGAAKSALKEVRRQLESEPAHEHKKRGRNHAGRRRSANGS
ncbi:MAG TPA: polyphosphate kinase 2 family protein [Candidatus Dormibacteraeota bacterium]|nr:polyphosphate kinase 2 family protein [Candidatus Dormibacteraeota bacterium]